MANASKQKGNAFERQIAQMFSDKFRHRFDGKDSFRRNVTSGGFFGGSNAYRADEIISEHQVDIGDIMCPPKFKFTIECKNYKTPLKLNALMLMNNSEFNGWITQAKEQAQLAKKDFLLIIKWNDTKPIVVSQINFEGKVNIKYDDCFICSFEHLLSLDDEVFFQN